MIAIIKRYRWLIAVLAGLGLILLAASGEEDIVEVSIVLYFAFLFFLAIRDVITLVKIKNERSKTELLHLKSQVNPHFFFNMLNNLYGLVETDAKKAQALILKLSEMMRYSIYEGQHDMVNLEDELEYLKNYIELHQMRYHKDIDITFNVAIEQEGAKVMPLLFIMLLENAFKHGVENLRANAFVQVTIFANKHHIRFAVENNFDSSEPTTKPGIGLQNLQRRLELAYAKKHDLSFSISEDVYHAELTLKLS